MKYEWKDGSRISLDANAVGYCLEAISVHGTLTPDLVLNEARRRESPLHRHFEWDDSEAAHQYRIVQARELIRSIVVISEPAPMMEPIRVKAFTSLPSEKGRSYVSTIKALDDTELRKQLLEEALKELRSFKAKYNRLTEFVKLFQEIQDLDSLYTELVDF